jgi:hypothetical protein
MVWKSAVDGLENVRCMVSESAVDGREKCGAGGEIGETSESLAVRHQDMTCVPTVSGFLVSWLRPLSTVQAAVAILFLPRCWDQHRDGYCHRFQPARMHVSCGRGRAQIRVWDGLRNCHF